MLDPEMIELIDHLTEDEARELEHDLINFVADMRLARDPDLLAWEER